MRSIMPFRWGDAVILFFALLSCYQSYAQTGRTLSRKESFFGLHFDFHAGLDDHDIGATLTEAMVDSLLRIVKPDFIQVDCKGHPGISSYPTLAGTPGTSFKKDPLKIFRDVTARHGVALYVHYSGVKDIQAIRLHPQWARRNADGTADNENTSVFSGYNDSLLIPQLRELANTYHINGAWVDGDCWATGPDYGTQAMDLFKKETGFSMTSEAPDSVKAAFLEFHRQAFLHYVQHYAQALHRADPNFQVASNWAFTSFMPQPVSVDIDFISGDLTPNNSVNNAAFEARCIAPQGRKYNKPWDIMSWGFSMNWDRGWVQTQKSVAQLSQEAAEIIAVGGGFQCYFTQNRDASIRPWQIPVMKGLSDFLRPRQPWCRNAVPIPQIALVYSGEGRRKASNSLFGSDGLEKIRGVNTALLDAQLPVEILMEHHLANNMQAYPLIVIPEWDYLGNGFRTELLDYASKGGNLLVIGPGAVKLFEREASVKILDQSPKSTKWLGYNGHMAAMVGNFQSVELKPGTAAFGNFYDVQDLRYAASPGASVASYGKGKIACVFSDFGQNYQENQSTVQRDFLKALVTRLFSTPLVRVEGSKLIHIVTNRLNDQTIIHLINTGGHHANKNVYAYDEVPPLGPLKLRIHHKKPSAVMLEPAHRPLPFTYSGGDIELTLPQLRIHSMLVID